jgi:hypothetical protein
MNTDDYTAAYWNAHTDAANPAKWRAVYREARSLAQAATNTADAARWAATAHAANVHYRVAREYGISPLSDAGREEVAARV